MKRLMLLCSMLVLLGTACKKDDSTNYAAEQAAVDDAAIQAYVKANGITATKDPSGVYYQIVTPGTGAYPTSSSTVNVNYTGKFLDGTTFDSGNYNNSLSGVIQGWQIGVPKINTGGRIFLLIPSALAYGPSGRGTIPANKVLTFTVDLLSFR
jgi:FKBP-type peptidyl-prolyl cis-trans isomerase FkpA